MNIDWPMLNTQKETLVGMLADTNMPLAEYEKEALQGIIHLIDALEDEHGCTCPLCRHPMD